MKTMLGLSLCAGLLVALTGCGGIAGHWALDSIKPETAKGDFQFGMVCLTKDGTYRACATYGGAPKKMTGTYKYDAAAETLTFTTEGGPERVYHAALTCMGGKLKVWSDKPGKEWTAIMKQATCCHGKKCGDATCCCCAMPAGAKPCAVKECPMMKKAAEKPAAPAPENK